MIRLGFRVPYKITVAVSGGPDSMACLDFLRRSRDVWVFHYNHGTAHALEAEVLIRNYCMQHNLPCTIGYLHQQPPKGASKEAFWHKQRYKFFAASTRPVVTCHHLDDQVESWVMSSMQGNPSLIPSRRENILRPFLLTEKQALIEWCHNKNVRYVIDPTNTDGSNKRSLLRKKLMHNLYECFPGLKKTVKKKVIKLYEASSL